MRSPLIALTTLFLVGASYGETLIEGEAKFGYESTKETVINPHIGMVSAEDATNRYVVDGLVYGLKIEAGTPTLFLMGKLESDSQGDQSKSVGVGAKWSALPESSRGVSHLKMTASLTQEDEHALETTVSNMALRSADLGGKMLISIPKESGETKASYGVEFLFSKIFSLQEDIQGPYKEFIKEGDKNASGAAGNFKVFAGYEGLLLELGMKFKGYNIETPVDGFGVRRTLKVEAKAFSGRFSNKLENGIKLSVFVKTDEYKRHDIFEGEFPAINDGPRTPYKLDLVTTSTRGTIGGEIEIPFRIGSGPAKSK